MNLAIIMKSIQERIEKYENDSKTFLRLYNEAMNDKDHEEASKVWNWYLQEQCVLKELYALKEEMILKGDLKE